MREIFETINILSFIQGYFHWMSNLTAWQLVGLLSFVLVNLLRNIGKPIALSVHNIFRRIRPLPFRNVDNAQIKITIPIPAHNEGVSRYCLGNNRYDVYGCRAFVRKSGIFSVYLLDFSAINSICTDFHDDDIFC